MIVIHNYSVEFLIMRSMNVFINACYVIALFKRIVLVAVFATQTGQTGYSGLHFVWEV